jgi:hypothetical protein
MGMILKSSSPLNAIFVCAAAAAEPSALALFLTRILRQFIQQRTRFNVSLMCLIPIAANPYIHFEWNG